MLGEAVVSRKMPQAGLPSPTLRDLLAVIFRQRWLALFSFTGILLASIVYWAVTPAYQAHMKILLRRGRLDPVVTAEANGPLQISRNEVTEEDLNSEVDLLRNESLLRAVVKVNHLQGAGLLDRLGLRRDDPERQIARGVRSLAGRLQVQPIRKSNLIVIRYDAFDPIRAARVLDTLATLYLEQQTRLRRPTGEFAFFEYQTARSRANLEEAQQRLVEYGKLGGIVSAALERDNSLQRCSELETTYRQARIARADIEQRIQNLQHQMSSFPPRTTADIRTSDNGQLLESLKNQLLALQLKRTELMKVYEPSYLLVREVDEQIAHLQASLETELASPLRDETTEKDPNYEWAKAELEKAQVERGALAAREVAIANELLTSRKEARTLGEAAIRQQDLLREMKTAEDTYLLYARKSEEARIGDALDERGILNVTVAAPPVVPALPKRPVWWVGLVALVAAGSASTAICFVADYLDPALRTPSEVVACLRTPVLASLPREAA
jgi:uncharacterized protein involved in exopolysaccharide biosynthesis